VLGFHPSVDGVFYVKEGTRMGAATYGAEGDAQGGRHGMGKAAIRAGGDVEKVEATLQQEGIKGFSRRPSRATVEGILLKKNCTRLLVGLKQTPSEEGAHVELGDPGCFQQGKRQLEAQFGPGQLLSPFLKTVLMLKG
jgi:hypothetical protein